MVEQLGACCTELQRLKEAQEVPALLALIKRLGALPVDTSLLRQTGVGREVNQSWLRRHSDETVRHASGVLVQQWKAGVAAECCRSPKVTSPQVTTPIKFVRDAKDEAVQTPQSTTQRPLPTTTVTISERIK